MVTASYPKMKRRENFYQSESQKMKARVLNSFTKEEMRVGATGRLCGPWAGLTHSWRAAFEPMDTCAAGQPATSQGRSRHSGIWGQLGIHGARASKTIADSRAGSAVTAEECRVLQLERTSSMFIFLREKPFYLFPIILKLFSLYFIYICGI